MVKVRMVLAPYVYFFLNSRKQGLASSCWLFFSSRTIPSIATYFKVPHKKATSLNKKLLWTLERTAGHLR